MAVPKKRKSYHKTRLKNSSKRYTLQAAHNSETCKDSGIAAYRSIHVCTKCKALVRPHMLHDHVAPCR